MSQTTYDVLLVIAGEAGRAKEFDIRSQLKAAGFDEEKFLFDFIACIPGFSLSKYRKLLKDKVSIFAVNCFGGIISHSLGLQFRSPTVNLWFPPEDFIHMMRHPQIYFSEQLEFERMRVDQGLGNRNFQYPIFRLGDAKVHMNHDNEKVPGTDIWQGEAKWYRRLKRINWYNFIAIMFTEDPKIAEKFDELPLGKKICFVPFHSKLDSAWYLEYPKAEKKLPYWWYVNNFAKGKPWIYDPFDMLLYGKKTVV